MLWGQLLQAKTLGNLVRAKLNTSCFFLFPHWAFGQLWAEKFAKALLFALEWLSGYLWGREYSLGYSIYLIDFSSEANHGVIFSYLWLLYLRPLLRFELPHFLINFWLKEIKVLRVLLLLKIHLLLKARFIFRLVVFLDTFKLKRPGILDLLYVGLWLLILAAKGLSSLFLNLTNFLIIIFFYNQLRENSIILFFGLLREIPPVSVFIIFVDDPLHKVIFRRCL